MNNTTNTISPRRLGIAFGATGVVFYLRCIITMGTVSHAKAIVFFNSLLHGLDVARSCAKTPPLVKCCSASLQPSFWAGSPAR
jgi:hypothetical protein